MLPTDGLDVRGTAEIRWNDRAVPYLVVEDELDVPYLMGVVHGHLRRTQMEILVRVARGELSELGGPFARDVDELLRTLDIDRAVPEIERALPPETRAWCERYAAGVNAQAAAQSRRPKDARVLGIDLRRTWTVADTLTVSRLASVDISLGRTFGLLGLRDQEGFAEHLARVRADGARGVPTFGPGQATPLSSLEQLSKSGSNCFVVAPQRSASGGALIASDPHLGFFLPNFWCLVGYATPERTVVGMTLPGVPVVALGRSDRIAWGGTNMAAFSSALYDVSALDESDLDVRRETLRTRLWPDRTIEVTETPYGPLVSKLALLEQLDLPPLALRWRGHEPSDEITAFLRASHASDWDEFRAAWEPYAVAGQNILYADVDGHIGQVLALEQIDAAAEAGAALIADPEDERFLWRPGRRSTDLPAAFDPRSGYLVSANNHPVLTEPPITAGGNSNDRVRRMSERIEAESPVSLDDLQAIQRDVYLASGLAAARALVAAAPDDASPDFVALVADWDGRYDRASRGAPAYRRWAYELLEGPYVDRLGAELSAAWKGAVTVHDRISADIESGWLTPDEIATTLERAAARHDLQQTWGDVHRLPLQHPLAVAPLIGRGWRFDELPGDGTLGTVRKTAGPFTPDRHRGFFGAQARHVSDLSDPDANWFVLLGGQDGWPGSENLIDQARLWEAGVSIRMPLRRASIEAEYPRVLLLGSRDG